MRPVERGLRVSSHLTVIMNCGLCLHAKGVNIRYEDRSLDILLSGLTLTFFHLYFCITHKGNIIFLVFIILHYEVDKNKIKNNIQGKNIMQGHQSSAKQDIESHFGCNKIQ